jgi:hypothetical protein
VAYADEEMLSEAKIDSPVATFSRSPISSCVDSGRPKRIERTRASDRSSGVRAADAAGRAISELSAA